MKSAKLPPYFQSIFWDTRLKNIDPKKHSRYVVERVLQWGRPEHVRWMLNHYSKRMILQVIKTGRELSDKNRNFWYVYLTRRNNAPRRSGARYQNSIWQNR